MSGFTEEPSAVSEAAAVAINYLKASPAVQKATIVIVDRYFSFSGRLARVPYFVRGLHIGIAAMVLFFASIPIFALGFNLAWWGGVIILAAAAVLLFVSSASLLVRRLHDIGLSGYHAIWVGAAELGSCLISWLPDDKQWIGLPLFGVALWVLLFPGKAVAASAAKA
ncbi:MAG: DUF805 domain-containing protein [Rhodopseudomonas sp.]|nr:DUF805 domain-containing protein [Rhodopseudomonas sp.]